MLFKLIMRRQVFDNHIRASWFISLLFMMFLMFGTSVEDGTPLLSLGLNYFRKPLTSSILTALVGSFANISSAIQMGQFEFECPVDRATATCCKAVLRPLGQETPVLCSTCKVAHFCSFYFAPMNKDFRVLRVVSRVEVISFKFCRRYKRYLLLFTSRVHMVLFLGFMARRHIHGKDVHGCLE
jgi:hypothetical protein